MADLDGDGVCEIITGVRDSNMDGASWFVLNLKGEIIGAYPHPGGAVCAPIVCDLNQDGKLDVIMSGTRGTGVVPVLHLRRARGRAGGLVGSSCRCRALGLRRSRDRSHLHETRRGCQPPRRQVAGESDLGQ